MKVSLIAAFSRNRVIGKDNKIPWRISSDLKRFKKLTMGHCLIMGRKSYESIGRLLPGRTSIIVTGQKNYGMPAPPPQSHVVESLDAAIAKAQELKDDECFIAGGGQIYREALRGSLLNRLYLTAIHRDFEGDVSFPEIDYEGWRETYKQVVNDDESVDFEYTFVNFERE